MKSFAVALVATLAVLGSAPAVRAQNDVDILNFALNLECLEAAFYSFAAFGLNLTDAYLGGGGPVYGGQQAALKGAALSYAVEIANDELDHVRFLRTAIGNESIPCPVIDIGGAFATLGNAAFGKTTSPAFSPYFDYINFYLGAFIFEDVGVTAYLGAAPSLVNKQYLAAALKIHGVEAYHGGILRSALLQNGFIPTQQGVNVTTFANSISALRAKLSGANDDVGILVDGAYRIAATGPNGLVYARTPEQVLGVVYGTGDATKPGLFFPNGVNGYYSVQNILNGRKK